MAYSIFLRENPISMMVVTIGRGVGGSAGRGLTGFTMLGFLVVVFPFLTIALGGAGSVLEGLWTSDARNWHTDTAAAYITCTHTDKKME